MKTAMGMFKTLLYGFSKADIPVISAVTHCTHCVRQQVAGVAPKEKLKK